MAQEPGSSGADPYRVLGVPPDATRDEIARAYRQLVRGSHPDLQGGDPAAPGRFREITGAYEVLGDPARRAHYDRQHPRPRLSIRPGGVRRGEPQIWAGPVQIEPPEIHLPQPGAAAPGAPAWPGPLAAEEEPLIRWLLWMRLRDAGRGWWT